MGDKSLRSVSAHFPFDDKAMKGKSAVLPTVRLYLIWAVEEKKCKVFKAHRVGPDGKPIFFIKISAPSGKYAILAGPGGNHRLDPEVVGHLDRKLGIKCPYLSI